MSYLFVWVYQLSCWRSASLYLPCVWGNINHIIRDLCGHCGSLQTVAWDSNRASSCSISAFELLAWLKTPVHLCTVDYNLMSVSQRERVPNDAVPECAGAIALHV